MFTVLLNRSVKGVVIALATVAAVGCQRSAPLQRGAAAAAEPTAAWTKAFNAGDVAALSALYADTARTLPPGGPAVVGRTDVESYWRSDLGEGGVTTTLTPVDTVAQGDLVSIEGTYEVKGGGDSEPAGGQYHQLWAREGGQWRVQQEMWRIDPTLHRQLDVAERLTSSWATAYNSGDHAALMKLYADDAALSTVQEGTIEGKTAIEGFWMVDLAGKPSSTLTVTDAYVAGELAHLEGDYKVTDSGKITNGRFIQLWMRDPGGWHIHREMWWR